MVFWWTKYSLKTILTHNVRVAEVLMKILKKMWNSTEISSQNRWENFINAAEDCFTKIEDGLISYNGWHKTGTEQQIWL